MARGRELSQLGSLINIEDSTKNIGVAAATPSQKVGIGTNSPTSKVEVVGDVLVSGIITATSFVGDGSSLTGVSGGGIGTDGSVNTTGIITATSFVGDGSNLTGLSRQLTIGVRVGSAVTVAVTGSSFNVSGRSGNVPVNI